MNEIPTPDELALAKEKVIQEIRDADEFVVFTHGDIGDGEQGVQTVLNACPAHYGFFAAAMQNASLRMAHSVLGEMLGMNGDEGDTEDVTSEWLHNNDTLPDPDTVEVPDFVPDFSDDAWNKPGGEFPRKADA